MGTVYYGSEETQQEYEPLVELHMHLGSRQRDVGGQMAFSFLFFPRSLFIEYFCADKSLLLRYVSTSVGSIYIL